MSLIPWSDDRVRFEKELKPGIAKLVRQVLPEYRLERAEQRFVQLADGTRRVQLLIEFSDAIAGLSIEEPK